MPTVRKVVWICGSFTISCGQDPRQEGPAEAVCAFGGVPSVFEGFFPSRARALHHARYSSRSWQQRRLNEGFSMATESEL